MYITSRRTCNILSYIHTNLVWASKSLLDNKLCDKPWSSYKCCQFIVYLNYYLICMHYNKYITISFMITCKTLYGIYIKVPHSAHAERPRRARKYPTCFHCVFPGSALCIRQVAALSLCEFNMIAAVWRSKAMAQRAHNAHTAATILRAPCQPVNF